MTWLFVVGAIVFEVSATLSLRMASVGKRKEHRKFWYIPVGVGYLASFWMLSLALAAGLPLGVIYGIWSAAGVALTAVLGRILFKEPFTWLMALGVALIIGGVLLVETGMH